jgi:hypothetical protein
MSATTAFVTGEDLPDILGILRRHGVVPVDLWVDTFTTGA